MFRERNYEKNDDGEFLIPIKRGEIADNIITYLHSTQGMARVKLVFRSKPTRTHPLCDDCRHCFAWLDYKALVWECEMCGGRNLRLHDFGTLMVVVARYVIQ
jgi:hypothetical protein